MKLDKNSGIDSDKNNINYSDKNAINYNDKKLKQHIKNIMKNSSEYVKKGLNIIVNTQVFTAITIICVLLKTVLFYKMSMYQNSSNIFSIVMVSFVFLIVIFAIPMLFKRKTRFIITVIFNFLLSALLCANEIYYLYSSNLISVSQISNLQYGREISTALPNLIEARQILYFIDIIAIIVLVILRKIKFNKNMKHYYYVSLTYVVTATLLACTVLPIWINKAKETQYNKAIQVGFSSIYGYYCLDISSNLNMKKNLKYKTSEAVLDEYNKLKQSYSDNYSLEYDFRNAAVNKNVIVLQLESVQKFVINKTINGKEITPNINKFVNENIEFTNMQNQSYSSTADSEFSEMNSVYPLENGMSFAMYPTNDYSDIFKMFKKNGYTTTYIHGNVGMFWNREAVYSRLQIDNLIFDDIFDENVERIHHYVSDEEVYKKSVELMKEYDNKFFVNIVASSSHMDFDLPGIRNKDEKVTIDVGEKYKYTLFGNYLESMNYADYAFGILIDELKKAGLYDDTVIFVYGDHAGVQMRNAEMLDFIENEISSNDIKTQINYSNVMCALKLPGVKHMEINKPTSKLDIKPTLTEICGIGDEFSLGTSMFSNKNFVGINNGIVITDKYFYNGNWYIIETGEMFDINNVSEELKTQLLYYIDCLQKELDISMSINILNLLKNNV